MTGRFVVMGVSGSGKSHVGAHFARVNGARFFDGDDPHPRANIEKTARDAPLTDLDRAPWLERIGGALRHSGTVVACSALRRCYRDAINDAAGEPATCLCLEGSHETLWKRMTPREGHFMPPALLATQMEPPGLPGPDESRVTASIERPPHEIVATFPSGLMEKTV